MKKRLALCLVFTMLLSMFAFVIPTGAAEASETVEIDPTAPTAVYGTPTIDGKKDALYKESAKIVADKNIIEGCGFTAYYANDAEYFYIYLEVKQTTELASGDLARIYVELVNTDENARLEQTENDYQKAYFPTSATTYNGGQFQFKPDTYESGRTRGADLISSYKNFVDYSISVTDPDYIVECRIPLTDALKQKVSAKEEVSIGIGYEVRYNNGSAFGFCEQGSSCGKSFFEYGKLLQICYRRCALGTQTTDVTDNKYNARFVATLDSLDVDEIGFCMVYNGKTDSRNCTEVYYQINANNGATKYNATQWRSEYIYAFAIEGLDASQTYTFTVAPYTVKDGVTTVGTAYDVTYTNGAFMSSAVNTAITWDFQ